MARTMSVAGGRTNRRFLLLAVFAAAVSAVLVYAAVNQTTKEGSSGGGAAITVPVVVAKTDIPARTLITSSMLEVRQLEADSISELVYGDPAQVVGKVTRFPVATSEQILSTKLVSLTGASADASGSLSFVIPKGMRAISISVDEVVSTGGLVLPGDYVDVVGVFNATFGAGDNQQEEEAYFARTILQNVEVLAVAQTVVDAPPDAVQGEGGGEGTGTTGQRERATEADPNPKAATVTMSVTQEEAQLLFLAEAKGTLRLAIRPFGEDDTPEVPFTAAPVLIPADLPAPTR